MVENDLREGGFTFSKRSTNCSPTSLGFLPSARFTLCSVPNRLIAMGNAAPLTFSNMSAGPPSSITLEAISVISKIGSTSAVILCRSPVASR